MYTRKYLGVNPNYHESPGCLLDYCFIERDLIAGCVRPVLCEECEQGVSNKKTAEQMSRELRKIRVPLYIRLLDYIQQQTILSLWIAFITSIFLGIVTNLLAAIALKGSFWHIVVVSTVPLLILCILITPFFSTNNDKKYVK